MTLKCKVKNWDGTDIHIQTIDDDLNVTARNPASIGPVNLFLHSLFCQVDVSFNDTSVSTLGDSYSYRAYITDLLSYISDVEKTWLKRLEGWHEDEAGHYDDQRNTVSKKDPIWSWTADHLIIWDDYISICYSRSDHCPTIWPWKK